MNTRVIDIHDPLWTEALTKLRHDIYQTPEYLAIEAKRIKAKPEALLIVDQEAIFFVPYLLRNCDDLLPPELQLQEVFDVISPYGYPGILLNQSALNRPGFADHALRELTQALKLRQVCSGFFRLHPLLNEQVAEIFPTTRFTDNGETVSVDLRLSESKMWSHTRRGHKSTINRCKREGLVARTVDFSAYMDQFIAIYKETMDRVEANQMYYFDRDYFLNLLTLGDRLHLGIVELQSQIICAVLFFECCGIVQAHLGGTKTEFLQHSPFSLLLHYVRLWAKERGQEVLHLGGGVNGSNEDNLFIFKSGFSRQRHQFQTLRLIVDPDKYCQLVNLRAKFLDTPAENLLQTNFFPAYRAH